jgi:hypothetical protein
MCIQFKEETKSAFLTRSLMAATTLLLLAVAYFKVNKLLKVAPGETHSFLVLIAVSLLDVAEVTTNILDNIR